MSKCETCEGTGKVRGIGCGPDGCGLIELACRGCQGSGVVTPATEELVAACETLRRIRQDRDLSLREAARMLKISATDLSDLERARRPVADVREAAAALAQPATREGE